MAQVANCSPARAEGPTDRIDEKTVTTDNALRMGALVQELDFSTHEINLN